MYRVYEANHLLYTMYVLGHMLETLRTPTERQNFVGVLRECAILAQPNRFHHIRPSVHVRVLTKILPPRTIDTPSWISYNPELFWRTNEIIARKKLEFHLLFNWNSGRLVSGIIIWSYLTSFYQHINAQFLIPFILKCWASVFLSLFLFSTSISNSALFTSALLTWAIQHIRFCTFIRRACLLWFCSFSFCLFAIYIKCCRLNGQKECIGATDTWIHNGRNAIRTPDQIGRFFFCFSRAAAVVAVVVAALHGSYTTNNWNSN